MVEAKIDPSGENWSDALGVCPCGCGMVDVDLIRVELRLESETTVEFDDHVLINMDHDELGLISSWLKNPDVFDNVVVHSRVDPMQRRNYIRFRYSTPDISSISREAPSREYTVNPQIYADLIAGLRSTIFNYPF